MNLEKFIKTGNIDLLKRELGFSRIEDCFAELCRQNNIQAIEKLLEKEGRYLMSINKNQIIETIVTYSNLETIRYFIEIKEYDKFLRRKENLLEIASIYNGLDVVKYFIEERKIPLKNLADSLLERAVCKNDNLEMLKYLVEEVKIDLSTKNFVVLSEAIKRKNLQAINYICSRQKEIDLNVEGAMIASLPFDSVESLKYLDKLYGFNPPPKDLYVFFSTILDNDARNVFDFFYKKYNHLIDSYTVKTLFYKAINKDSVYFLDYLIKQGNNLDLIHLFVDEFLENAINNGKVNVTWYLIKEYKETKDYPLIAEKVVNGSIFINEKIKLMKYLLSKCPECIKNEETISTFLSYLAKFGEINKFKKIIEKYNLDPTIGQNIILLRASETSDSNIEVMKYLVEKGCKFEFAFEPFVKNFENACFMINNGYWQADFDKMITIERLKKAEDYIDNEKFLKTICFYTTQIVIKEWVNERLKNKELEIKNNFMKNI